jgi:hypothetical protein
MKHWPTLGFTLYAACAGATNVPPINTEAKNANPVALILISFLP